MLPYQERLERLLESLFDDDVASEEVKIWNEPSISGMFSACCSYSYTNYGG
jgi:hypothetical protein